MHCESTSLFYKSGPVCTVKALVFFITLDQCALNSVNASVAKHTNKYFCPKFFFEETISYILHKTQKLTNYFHIKRKILPTKIQNRQKNLLSKSERIYHLLCTIWF